ncbi:small CPxCG-related zinc finger protein [Natronomonas moolapensis 8.8.11]|uniref:Small CPxCG-related zinc finger protein n=1 Tax=Natronomonas moolapensis (strain DSM 18674 / CECT 7526 / JCM 14361 / 8.8.11) TaxID=268739 RepID=M1XSX8_NATM8|nr:small CPxCG-related zinc finger protein [Natronomonas moolapensis]CCQ37474.1 small CPxCG-related zinc finger protein [Natronomonas moolapensis 8.8.11]
MECPRCGGPLSRYQLGEKVSYACDECVYVGVEVNHRATPRPLESWEEALSRFYHRRTTEQSPPDSSNSDTLAERAERAEATRDADGDGAVSDAADGDDSSGTGAFETQAGAPADEER